MGALIYGGREPFKFGRFYMAINVHKLLHADRYFMIHDPKYVLYDPVNDDPVLLTYC